MKKLLISTMVLGLVLTSCGSNESAENSTVKLKPQSTKITGVLSKHYEVVNKEYKIDIASDDFYPVISISIKRISSDLPFDPAKTNPFSVNGSEDMHIGFGIELFDANGNSIETINATSDGLGGVYDPDDIQSVINMQNGETSTVRWSFDIEVLKKARSFRITSALEVRESYDSEASDDSDESIETSEMPKASGSVDKLLDSYESYINSYITLTKKMAKNDEFAMQEYPKFMEKTQKLTEELDKNQGDMSDAQMSRFMKLQAKFMKAASSIK